MPHLLAVGDLHGDTRMLARLLDAEPDADVLLCVGDWGDPGQVPDAFWADLLGRIYVLTVFGNHDDLSLLGALRNRNGDSVLLAQAESRSVAGLTVAGVSGIWAKSHRLPHYVTDEDVAGYASKLRSGPPIDILLTHGCPIGIADRTPSGRPGGQRCFLDLLKALRPRVHLCGHLHVAQRRDVHLPTPCTVLNTGALRDGDYARLTPTTEGELQAELLRLDPTG